MNMLANEKPCGLLNEKEIDCFLKIGKSKLQIFTCDGDWRDTSTGDLARSFSLNKANTYRLKLQEGEQYYKQVEEGDEYFITVNSVGSDGSMSFTVNNTIPFDKDLNGRTFSKMVKDEDAKIFRPLTKSEIDSVKPKFKKGDVVQFVVVTDNQTHVLRVKDFIGEINVFSSLYDKGCVDNKDHFQFSYYYGLQWKDKITHATPGQIKELERQEMLHGQKWNAEKEGYDEFLTSDGLTLKELLKHDNSDWQLELSCGNWIKSDNSKDEMIKAHITNEIESQYKLSDYRLKPQETFVDVEIEWVGSNGFISTTDGDRIIINKLRIGYPLSIGVLSRFLFEGKACYDKPFKFGVHGKTIELEATHARFVKVGK